MQSDTESLVESIINNDQNDPQVSSQSCESVDITYSTHESEKFPQYFAALAATLGALSSGIILGWTSPLEDALRNAHFNDIEITLDNFGWIGSLTTLGACFACLPTGILCDKIGRRTVLLLLYLPFCAGWMLILFAQNVAMLYAGRFLHGLAVGGCCVAAPMYISEVAETEIRGRLGSFFQLMVTVGILFSYLFGALLDPKSFTAVCSMIPALFGVIFVFQPETPLYYMKIGKLNDAKCSLLRLRGKDFNVEDEMREMQDLISEGLQLNRRACKKASIIGLELMFFQQFSGINAIIFYTSDIFKTAKVSLDAKYATIIVGVFQVVATFVSSLIVDKVGRKSLLAASALLMCVTLNLLALFLVLRANGIITASALTYIGFLPILLLVTYIVAFSLGFGPIPWIMLGEIFSPDVKGFACSIAGSANWLMAFIITKAYLPLDQKVGDAGTFSMFGFLMLYAFLQVITVMIETKGKSLSEIQDELECT